MKSLFVLLVYVLVIVIAGCKPATSFIPDEGTAYFEYIKYTGSDEFYTQNTADSCHIYNPILPGFYPDPSICQKGDDYYLVNSTFSYFPGVPVFHSKDLVHWEQIGHVLDRPSQLNIIDQPVSAGIYAASIDYNPFNETFYMVTTFVGGGGNFIVSARDPKGPWSDPVWLPEIHGIDPSLFFDEDGKTYICNTQDPEGGKLYEGHTAIWIQEFDLDENKMVGPRKMIRSGGHNIDEKPVWLEGPHIYKKEGYYYLLSAEGGTSIDHSVVIFRSKNIWGPYETNPNNPILTQRGLDPDRCYPVTNAGHADLFQTPQGDWYATFLACRPYDNQNTYNIGRETFMLPVKWEGEWPVILCEGLRIPLQIKAPTQGIETPKEQYLPTGNFTWEDTFADKKLDYRWIFLRTPIEEWYSFPENSNGVILQLRDANLREIKQPSFLACRQQHHTMSLETNLKFEPQRNSDLAGLALFQNEAFHIVMGVTKIDDKVCLVVQKAIEKGNVVRNMSADAYDSNIEKSIIYQREINSIKEKGIGLRVSMRNDVFVFSINTNGKWEVLPIKELAYYLSTSKAGGFVGTVMGPYASSND